MYGWQLAIFIVLANVFKYPFFRFATDYTYDANKTLVQGYADKGKAYLWVFFFMAFVAGIINTGAVAMLCAVILGAMLPEAWTLSIPVLSVITIIISWLFLVAGHYKLLDGLTKWIVISLTVTTLLAVVIAMGKPSVVAPDFVPASPWNLATLGFIVALMGWMPAPIEISALTSTWTVAKTPVIIQPSRTNKAYLILTWVIGLRQFWRWCFWHLVYWCNTALGKRFSLLAVNMWGNLSVCTPKPLVNGQDFLVAFIAFMCMFGTTITVIDGYARVNAEAVRIVSKKAQVSKMALNGWLTFFSVAGLVLILYFGSQLTMMLKFAMIMAFCGSSCVCMVKLQPCA